MLVGSKLSLNVPFIRVGYCSIIVMQDLRSFKLYSKISLPSIKMDPSAGYKILRIHPIKVDLPAPVRPTIPTLSPESIRMLMFLMTNGRSSR
jgi:hypothetical protein